MRKIVFVLLSLVFVYADDVAFVKKTFGYVKVKRNDQTFDVKVKDKLRQGDIIITGSKSGIGIIFNDGSTLTLDESSFLEVSLYQFEPIEKKFDFQLNLNRGSAIFESGKISKLAPENFQFHIPKGTIGIRGTKFLVKVD